MGFAQEMRDALSAFTTVSDNFRKDRAEDRQGKYYDALIQNQKASQDLNERKFGESKRQFDVNKALAIRNANETSAQHAFDRQYKTTQQGIDAKYKDGLINYYNALAKKGENGGLPDFTGAGNAGAANIGAGPAATPFPAPLPNAPAPQQQQPQAVPVAQGTVEEEDANGGLVGRNMRFAQGGAVPDEPMNIQSPIQQEQVQQAQAPQAIPAQPVPTPRPNPQRQAAIAPQQEAIPVTSQSNPTPKAEPTAEAKADKTSGGFDAAKALESWGVTRDVAGMKEVPQNPVTLGLDYLVHSSKPTVGVPDGSTPPTSLAQTMASGEGAADEPTIQKLHEIVDPHNELTPAAKRIATLDAVTKYYLGQGDVRKAAQAAASLIETGRLESQKFGALAVVAIQHGNLDAATKYLSKAYDTVPDGNTLKAKVVDGVAHMTTSDPYGNETDLGPVDAQHLIKLSLGVANGSEYMNRMIQIASGNIGAANQQQPKADAAASKPMKVSDLSTLGEQADKASSDWGTAHPNDDTALQGKQVERLRAATYHILQQNPGLDRSEALGAANAILTPPGKDGVPFIIDRDKKTGQNTLKFDNGRNIVMSDDELRPLMVLRGKLAKEAEDEAAKNKGKKGWAEAGKRTADAAGRIAKDAGRAVGAMGEAFGNAAKRGYDALPSNPQFTSDMRNLRDDLGNKGQPGVDNPL